MAPKGLLRFALTADAAAALSRDTDPMEDEITCEGCGARVSLLLGDTGWPTLANAASVTDVHRECLRRPADALTA